MVTDPIADLLTRIRNAQRAGHKSVRVSPSRLTRSVLDLLKSEGFIDGFDVKKDRDNKFDEVEVVLRYSASGDPVIRTAVRVSKPGRRVYSGVQKLPRVLRGLGMAIVSTSSGIISDREARRRKIGGEVLAYIG